MTIRDYSTTPASNNAAPPNGWPEGQAASTVNDCARQMMAEIRESFEELPYFDYGDDPTRVDNDTFTVAGDLTARYPVGSRVKLVGATTGTGRISVSSHAAGTTTIDVVMDSGNVPASLVRAAVAPAPVSASTASPAAVTLTASPGTSGGVSRDDHVHALSQAIAPTWSGKHTFSLARGASQAVGIMVSNAFPFIILDQSTAAANNRYWDFGTVSEQLLFRIANDADNTTTNWLTVDRTGTTVDRVAFPTDNNAGAFSVGVAPATTGAMAHVSTATSSAAALTVKSTTAATGTLFVWNTATAGDNVFEVFLTEGSSGTTRGSISYNRGGGVVAYNTTSDERLKENIRDSISALGLISNIRVRAFDWKNMPGSAQRYWLVAQELALVMPEAVSIPENEEGFWSLDASKLVPLAIKGMQEQQAQIQALTARVAALEGVRAGAISK